MPSIFWSADFVKTNDFENFVKKVILRKLFARNDWNVHASLSCKNCKESEIFSRFYFLVRCTLQIWIHTISGAKINIFFYSLFSWRVHLYSEQKKNQGKMSFRLYRNLKLIYLQKLQPCRWYNNKYMIASTQTTSIEVFLFITVLVFFLSCWAVKFCLETEKTIETIKKATF